MPVQLLKDIKVQAVHSEEYFPKNITKGEWYDVIGVNSHSYIKEDKEGRKKTETRVKFLIVNNEMKVTQVDMSNCLVVDQNRDTSKQKSDNEQS